MSRITWKTNLGNGIYICAINFHSWCQSGRIANHFFFELLPGNPFLQLFLLFDLFDTFHLDGHSLKEIFSMPPFALSGNPFVFFFVRLKSCLKVLFVLYWELRKLTLFVLEPCLLGRKKRSEIKDSIVNKVWPNSRTLIWSGKRWGFVRMLHCY